MTPKQISDRLNSVADSVCRHLLPDGKRQGHEWVVGNLDGAAGDSLKICISGSKIGVGADFATGQTFGDLLDVWMAARGCDLKTAMLEASNYLGVQPDGRGTEPKKIYRRPDRPREVFRPKPGSSGMAYLLSRGLTPETVAAFQVAVQPVRLRFAKELRAGDLKNPDGETLVFPFKRDGELLNCKYLAVERSEDGKKFTQQEGGAEPCLFGWQAVPANARAVAITEGEIDAMTLHQCGIPALSVPMGGGGGRKQDWIESDYDHLERFDTLYLCLDMDEPGKQATAEIVKRLGADRCRVVELPLKDANECLQNGWGKAEFSRAFAAARTLDPEELKPATAFLSAVLHEFFPAPDESPGLDTPWPKVGGKLRFRRGETTLWTGINGHGKSLALNHLVAHGTAHGERFCVASMEMQPARTLHRLIRQLTGLGVPSEGYIRHTVGWLGERLWLFDLVGTAKVDRMLEVFRYAVRRYGIRHFVLDSLAKCGLAEDDYPGQKALVESLVDFAHRNDAHVHLVAHARKGQDEYSPPGKMDVKGTGAITDLVDNVVTVWRNKRKEEQRAKVEAEGGHPAPDHDTKPDAALIVTKQRYLGWEGEVWLWFDPECQQYIERVGAAPFRYVPYTGSSANGRP